MSLAFQGSPHKCLVPDTDGLRHRLMTDATSPDWLRPGRTEPLEAGSFNFLSLGIRHYHSISCLKKGASSETGKDAGGNGVFLQTQVFVHVHTKSTWNWNANILYALAVDEGLWGAMAAAKGDPETAGQRFAHLLMPIRDLAKNWEIDIASDLEGYLEEVRLRTVGMRNISWNSKNVGRVIFSVAGERADHVRWRCYDHELCRGRPAHPRVC